MARTHLALHTSGTQEDDDDDSGDQFEEIFSRALREEKKLFYDDEKSTKCHHTQHEYNEVKTTTKTTTIEKEEVKKPLVATVRKLSDIWESFLYSWKYQTHTHTHTHTHEVHTRRVELWKRRKPKQRPQTTIGWFFTVSTLLRSFGFVGKRKFFLFLFFIFFLVCCIFLSSTCKFIAYTRRSVNARLGASIADFSFFITSDRREKLKSRIEWLLAVVDNGQSGRILIEKSFN